MKNAANHAPQFMNPLTIEERGEEDTPDVEFIDFDEFNLPSADDHDARWDVFIPDDDERDPLPEPGDFWIDFESVGSHAPENGRRARFGLSGAVESAASISRTAAVSSSR